MSGDSDPRTAALQAELDAVRRRESEYRAKMVQEFLDRGERNTYLHTLRGEKADLVKQVQAASADLEDLTRKLEAATERAAAVQAELDAVKASLSWRIGRMFGPAPKPVPVARPAANAPAAGGTFTYYLHTSPFRLYRDASFTFRGWAWPESGASITAIRVNIDGRLFPGLVGLEEPEVIARYGPQPANPKPGFEVTFDTPPGRHLLALEAQVANTEWRTVMCTTIWSESPAA
jgi:hypothetical protein